jgi:hypothetical protein
MASINVDPNAWVNFILRYFFAGVWIALGWAVANALVIPHIPFI